MVGERCEVTFVLPISVSSFSPTTEKEGATHRARKSEKAQRLGNTVGALSEGRNWKLCCGLAGRIYLLFFRLRVTFYITSSAGGTTVACDFCKLISLMNLGCFDESEYKLPGSD